MDSLSTKSSYWNGRINEQLNQLYSDLYNVSPIDVPYSRTGRPTSFFLETRGAYTESLVSRHTPYVFGQGHNQREEYLITDAKIIWDDEGCDKQNGVLRCHYLGINGTSKMCISYKIKDKQIKYQDRQALGSKVFPTSKCISDRFTVTNFVKHEVSLAAKPTLYQVNTIIDSVTTYGQIGCVEFDNGEGLKTYDGEVIHTFNELLRYSGIDLGAYVFIDKAGTNEGDGICGQARQILSINDGGNRLNLSSVWLGMPDIKPGDTESVGNNVSVKFYKDWGEVVLFATSEGVVIASGGWDKDDDEYDTYHYTTVCDYGYSKYGDVQIVDTDVYNDKFCALMSNGYLYHGGTGYNKLFFNDSTYVGADKDSISSWRGILLIMGERKIDVGIESNEGFFVYTQTNNIGIRNKRSYGEYEGSMLIISSERQPRLLAVKVASTSGNQMLEFEDIGGYIQSELDKLRSGEDVRLDTCENDLALYFLTDTTTKSSHNINTRIFFYSKRRKIWYEHFTYSTIYGSLKNFFYGSGIITYSKYDKDGVVNTHDIFYKYKEGVTFLHEQLGYYIPSKIARYINENEYGNGQVDISGNLLDLFRVLKCRAFNLVLGRGRYSEGTKMRITNYRHGYAVHMDIDKLSSNKWADMISRVTNGYEPDADTLECIDADVRDSEKYNESCESTVKTFDVEKMDFVGDGDGASRNECAGFIKRRVSDNSVCVDDWEYNYTGSYPIRVNVNEESTFGELLRFELISGEGDSLSFGGAIVELEVKPLDYTGEDGEYTVDFKDDCPLSYIRKPEPCSPTGGRVGTL